MKTSSAVAVVVVCLLSLTLLTFPPSASAREMVLPAGTLLQCTMDEPNFSSATVAIGDPVLCHLRSMTEFGRQAFPRGSYLVGHLEAAQDPGHFWGKGYMKIQFDRIGFPQGDMPLDAKVVATRGYKVDKYGDIDGKGHAKRDIVEWMIPPLWPWKIITLPARGPRPTLKGESQLTLRLMDDVEIPQVSQTYGPDWHFFGGPRPDNDAYIGSLHGSMNQGAGNGSLNGSIHGSVHASFDASVSNASLNRDSVPHLATRRQFVPQSSEPTLEEVPAIRYASYTPSSTRSASTISASATTMAATRTAPAATVISEGFAGSSQAPVFALKTGTVLTVGHYTCQDGRISYELAAGGSGVISADEVDWTTTDQMNLQRGVRMTLHASRTGSGATGL